VSLPYRCNAASIEMVLLVSAVRLLARNAIASEIVLESLTYLYEDQQSYWYNRAAEERMRAEGREGEGREINLEAVVRRYKERVRNSMQLEAAFERLGLLEENERMYLAVEIAGEMEEIEAEKDVERRERGEGEGGEEGEIRE
jgi:hypothetical protein